MKSLLSCLFLLMASGCSILPESKPPAAHDFGLPLTPSQNKHLPQPQVTVDAPGWLDDTRIRYRLLYAAPTQVRFYTLDQWVAPPHELFGQLLATGDKNWPQAFTVQLQNFEQHFDAPGHAIAVMRFSVTVSSPNNDNKVLKKDFVLQQTCSTADAKGAVDAFSKLANRAVGEIDFWLNQTD